MPTPPKPRPGEPIRLTFDGKNRPRYKVRIRVAGGDSGAGQRFANGTFDSLTEARNFVEETRSARRKGEVSVTSKMPFRDYAEEWLRRVAASPRVRPNTLVSYTTHVNLANAAFGDKALGKITRADIEQLVADYAAKGRSVTSSAYTLRQLRAIFRDAQEDGLITRNPAAKVEAQGRPKVDRDALTPAELRKVREVLRTGKETADDWALWQLTLAGLRRGEVMGLRWNDIDLKAGTVSVRRSRVKTLRGEQIGKPKTRRGERTLYVGEMPELVEALKALRERQLATYGGEQVRTGYLALNDFGEPLGVTRWTKRWYDALEAAGVRRLPLHAARHTAVTMLRNAGVPDYVVAAWAGHDETVMRGVYTHVQEKELRAAGTALASVIGA